MINVLELWRLKLIEGDSDKYIINGKSIQLEWRGEKQQITDSILFGNPSQGNISEEYGRTTITFNGTRWSKTFNLRDLNREHLSMF
jgi:hypothetical protein